VEEMFHSLRETGGGIFMVVGHTDTGSQNTIVGVGRGKVGCDVAGVFIYLTRFDPSSDRSNDPLGDTGRVYVKASAHVLYPCQDFIEGYCFVIAIALNHVHLVLDSWRGHVAVSLKI